jgi:hypothetical protein
VFAGRFAALPGARGWARYSLSMGILQVVVFIVANVTATLDQNGTFTNPPTGLLQRVGIVTGWIWLSLVALRELRALPQPVSDAVAVASRHGQASLDETPPPGSAT